MSILQENPEWADGIYQLTEETPVLGKQENVSGDGPSNIQAQQLANRTLWLKEEIQSTSDYREYTFYTSETDPDGTIAGRAGTPLGKTFRVAIPDAENVIIAFIYYRNDGDTATYLNSVPNNRYIENVIDYIAQEVRKRTNLISSSGSDAILSLCDEWGYEAARVTESSFETVTLQLIRTSSGPLFLLADEYGNAIKLLSENGALIAGNNEFRTSEHLLSFQDEYGNEIVLLDKQGRQYIGENIIFDAPEWAHVVLDESGWVIFGYKNDGTYVGPDTGGGSNIEPVPSVIEADATAHWLFGYEGTSYLSRVGNKSVTPQSAPEFNQNYISLAAWNGALISDIPESGEFTVCTVVRIPEQLSLSDCVVIYGTQNGYSLRDDDDTYTGNQLSLFSDRESRRWIRSKISGYRGTSRHYPTTYPPTGQWLFIAHVVKLTGDGERFQVISVGGNNYQKLREADSDRLILSGRTFAIGNAYCDVPMFKTKGLDIAECIYFDSALSQQDIQHVYQNSRQRMTERRISLL
ncbi:hypothetical protein ACHADD_000872 [Klebsiella pneumoniae]